MGTGIGQCWVPYRESFVSTRFGRGQKTQYWIPIRRGLVPCVQNLVVNSNHNGTIIITTTTTTRASSLKLQTLAQVLGWSLLAQQPQQQQLQQQANDSSLSSSLIHLLQQPTRTGLTLLAPTDTAFASMEWKAAVQNWTNDEAFNTTNSTTSTTEGNAKHFMEQPHLLDYHVLDANLYTLTASLLLPTVTTTHSGYSLWISTNEQNTTCFNGIPSAQMSPYYVQNG